MVKDSNISINLRTEHLKAVLDDRKPPGFFEVIADNWLSEGPHHQKLEAIRNNQDLFFHCVGMNLGGIDPLRTDYLENIRELVGRFQPNLISDHLCIQSHQGIFVHDLLPFPLTRSHLKLVSERVDEIQNFFDRQVLIENLSYYHVFESSEMSESDFMNELVTSTGCGMLLDLNNIDINDQNQIASSKKYLSDIDLDQVKEIHIAGGERQADLVVDTHGSKANQSVLAMLDGVLKLRPDLPVIYEWDMNVPDYQILKSYLGDLCRNEGI